MQVHGSVKVDVCTLGSTGLAWPLDQTSRTVKWHNETDASDTDHNNSDKDKRLLPSSLTATGLRPVGSIKRVAMRRREEIDGGDDDEEEDENEDEADDNDEDGGDDEDEV